MQYVIIVECLYVYGICMILVNVFVLYGDVQLRKIKAIVYHCYPIYGKQEAYINY